MSEKKIKAIYGTRDILPDESEIWIRIVKTVNCLASKYNYKFINSPIFEATELFARGIGETSDIVTKEMYTFKDRGDRSLTLRPEGTASVIRSYIEHSMGAAQGLVKVWYAGPMFRQERPQAGRYRQFFQFGIEAIGSLDPSIDAEIIAINYNIMAALGIEGITLFLNSIGIPEDRKAHKESFSEFIKPKFDSLCADCQKRYELNLLRMFDCKNHKCRSLLKNAPTIFDFLSDENRDHFNKVCEYLDKVKIPFELDKRLVRGLDYYTRTAWEIKSEKLGAQDSISGGGRYDLLVEQLGGKPTPAIGFAAGFERIIMSMPEETTDDENNFGFFIAIHDKQFKKDAFSLAMKIRELSISADIDFLGRSLKAQMKQADKSGFKYSMIIAEDEMERGKIVVRNMANSKQFELRLEDIYHAEDSKQFGELIERGQ